MLYTSGISTQADEVDILKSGFAQAGIQLSPQGETFDTLLGDTVPCKPTQASCKWDFLYLGGWLFNGPGFEPTGEALYQTGVPSNSGSYSDPTMDQPDRRHAHQQQHQRVRHLRQLHGDAGAGAVDAVGHRDHCGRATTCTTSR